MPSAPDLTKTNKLPRTCFCASLHGFSCMSLRGDRLAQLRKEAKLSQTALAKQFDMNPNQISRYETGVMNPSYEMLVQIAQLFNTTTDYLLGLSNKRNADAEPEPDVSVAEAEMLALMRQYDPDFQAQIVAVFKSLDETWQGQRRDDDD